MISCFQMTPCVSFLDCKRAKRGHLLSFKSVWRYRRRIGNKKLPPSLGGSLVYLPLGDNLSFNQSALGKPGDLHTRTSRRVGGEVLGIDAIERRKLS